MRKNEISESSSKRSRAKYKYPPKLKFLIDIVNLVPLNIKMNHFDDFDKNSKELFFAYLQTLPEGFRNYLRSVYVNTKVDLSKIPSEISDELRSVYSDGYKYGFMLGFYRSFYEKRKSIEKFINYVDRLQKGEKIDQISEPLIITTSIKFIKLSERVEANLTDFASLIGHFEADRLRICETCSLLFWAKRKESKTCSAKCYNNFRQKLYRKLTDEEKAQRKTQRKANRERNLKLKKMRKKSNGTL